MLNLLRRIPFLLATSLLCSCAILRGGSSSQPLRCVPSAHRGEHSSAPDNSDRAIRSAVHHSIPYIELDIRPTADGELILFHDKRLSRENSIAPEMLYGRIISSLTKNEILVVKNTDGSPILHLSDALNIVDGSQSILQLDVKPDTSEALEKVLRIVNTTRNVSRNLIVQCQHITCLQYITQSAPSLRVLARVFSLEEFSDALRYSPYFIQVDAHALTPDMIEAAHARKSKVLVKTLGIPPDSSEHWYRLCLLGVDTILTDHPLQFLKSIAVAQDSRDGI